jgi:hypothetical protein
MLVRHMPVALLSDQEWREVRSACESGVSFQRAAETFGINVNAIKQRSWRERWVTGAKVEKVTRNLQAVTSRNPTPKTAEIVAQSLLERQEEHKGIVHRTILKALKAAEKAPPAIESMTDYEKAVKVHRLNLDMTTGESAQVNLSFWHGEAGQGLRDVGPADALDVEVIEAEGAEWV